MSRPVKKGLDYFPMAVDFFQQDGVKFCEAECGCAGVAVLMKLLCAAYMNGYYAQWGEGYAEITAMDMYRIVSGEEVEKCVRMAVDRGIFDKGLFEKYSILTSRDIQTMYVTTLDSKRYKVINKDYWLIDLPKRMKEDPMPTPAPAACAPTIAEKPAKPTRKPREPRQFVAPTLEEVVAYFNEKGYKKEAATKAFDYYQAGGWKDATGKPVKCWKQKMLSVWMKPEYKLTVVTADATTETRLSSW